MYSKELCQQAFLGKKGFYVQKGLGNAKVSMFLYLRTSQKLYYTNFASCLSKQEIENMFPKLT